MSEVKSHGLDAKIDLLSKTSAAARGYEIDGSSATCGYVTDTE